MQLINWAIQADLQFRANPFEYENVDFDLPSSRIFYIDKKNQLEAHSTHANIYDGLRHLTRSPIPNCQILGIETCGWAAPAETNGVPDGKPSKHPARRHVRMITVVDQYLKTAHMFIFKDDPENPEFYEDGSSDGSLARALCEALVRNAIACVFNKPEH